MSRQKDNAGAGIKAERPQDKGDDWAPSDWTMHVEQSYFGGNAFAGIQIESHKVLIDDNYFTLNTAGITSWQRNKLNTIQDNTFLNNGNGGSVSEGLYFTNIDGGHPEDLTIRNNTIIENRDTPLQQNGIYFHDRFNPEGIVTVQDNHIQGQVDQEIRIPTSLQADPIWQISGNGEHGEGANVPLTTDPQEPEVPVILPVPEAEEPAGEPGGEGPVFSVAGSSSFDGRDDRMVIDHDLALDLDRGTVAWHFKADDLSGAQGLLSKDSSGYDAGGHLSVWLQDDQVVVRLQSEDASHELRSTRGSVQAGEETHAAVSFGADGLKLYLDGELAASDDYRGGLQGNEEPLVVGARAWQSGDRTADNLDAFFQGTIGPIEVYGRALASAELEALVTGSSMGMPSTESEELAGPPVAESEEPAGTPVAEAEEPTGPPVAETEEPIEPPIVEPEVPVVLPVPEAEEPAGEPGGEGPVFSVAGSSSFDGRDDRMVIDHDLALDLDRGTVAWHFKADDLSGAQGLLSKDSSGYDAGGHLSVWLQDDQVVVRLQSEDASHELRSTRGSVQAGEETHAAVSFGADGLKLYLDGELAASDDYRGGLQGNEEPLVVGARAWQSGDRTADNLDAFFQGTIGPIEVYGRALASAELEALVTGSSMGMPSTESEELAGPPVAESEEPAGTPVAEAEEPTGPPVAETEEPIEPPIVEPEVPVVLPVPEAEEPAGEPGGEGPVFSVAGSSSFDGRDDRMVIDHDLALDLDRGTVAWHFKADDLSGAQGLLSKDSSGYDAGGHLSVWLQDDQVVVRLQSEDASHELRSTRGSVQAGEETHAAVSFGADGLKLYLDGELAASDDYRGGLQGNEEPLVVGARAWQSGDRTADNLDAFFQGTIGPIEVYGSSLDDTTLQGLASLSVLDEGALI